MYVSKRRYIQGFALIVILLGVVRAVVDERNPQHSSPVAMEEPLLKDTILPRDSMKVVGKVAPHRILSVRSYSDAFPDAQDVQIVAANKWGVKPVSNRADAERRKSELVYVGSNPYFFIEPLYQSIPYLVPRASNALQEIGRCFFDSLQVKGLPLHKIIVTSVLRTKEDVTRLRRHNGNATENSCHMYGTTFDIAYNRYLRVEENDSAYSKRRTVADVRLKQILSEVLNDQRHLGRCYVKYEVKQGCFHITVR